MIQTATRIESQPNTELDRIKELEKAWGRAQGNIRTLLDTADLWLAIADGAPVQAEDYLLLQHHTYRPQDLDDVQQANAHHSGARRQLAGGGPLRCGRRRAF